MSRDLSGSDLSGSDLTASDLSASDPTDRCESAGSETSTSPGESAVSPDFPRHVAIIMDGNGRWAQAKNLPRIEGHRRGVSTVRMVSETSSELGLDAVTLYCLSSENWKRPEAELQFLMHLLEQYLIEERRTIMDQGLRLKVIGRRDRLPPSVLAEMERTLEMSADNPGTQLVLAIDYGGRDEIASAVRTIVSDVQAGKLDAADVSEQTVSDHLYTAGLPDVDLMIRTGGELRVSNFLLWQISYAELWVTETCWPDFSRDQYVGALHDFASRDRRFGGLSVGR